MSSTEQTSFKTFGSDDIHEPKLLRDTPGNHYHSPAYNLCWPGEVPCRCLFGLHLNPAARLAGVPA